VRLTLILLTISCTLVTAQSPAAPPTRLAVALATAQDPPERSIVGTLDEIGATTIVVKTGSTRQTFALEKGATIRQGSKVIKRSELPEHKGERVKVRYRDEKGVHHAEWVVVASPASVAKGKGSWGDR
jgi:hypothetical protein